MALQGLTSGIDVTLNFTDVNGILRFALLESFTGSEQADVTPFRQINGITSLPEFHSFWQGSFITGRNSNVIDAYFATKEAIYYSGGDQLPVTISKTIKEADGSISQMQWTNVTLKYEDIGTYSGGEIVKQHISWMASRYLIIL